MKQYTVYKNKKAKARYLEYYDKLLKRWPGEYQSLFVSTSYGNIHYLKSGMKEKPPLVLFHGGGTNLLMWIPIVKYLSKDFCIYSIDNPDQPNKSEGIRPFTSIEDYMSFFKEFLDAIAIKKAYFAGLSQGGWFSLNIPLFLPEYTIKSVAMCPVFGLYPADKSLLKSTILLSAFPTLKKVRKYLLDYSAKDIIDDDFFNEYTKMVYRMLKCYKMPKSMVKHPLLTKDDFEKAQCPILVIIGENEIIYNADDAIECAKQNIPNVHTVKIADCGHTIQYDQPELAAREIIDFFYEH